VSKATQAGGEEQIKTNPGGGDVKLKDVSTIETEHEREGKGEEISGVGHLTPSGVGVTTNSKRRTDGGQLKESPGKTLQMGFAPGYKS